MTDKILNEYVNAVNSRLDEHMAVYTEKNAARQLICPQAMKYSLSAGGKRIRPVLAMELCRMLCGDRMKAIDAACAIEMIHTFSLIHDDLPCMDDDDMRRGKPSCHKAFGEANALLAGDALECYAFEVIAGSDKLDDRIKAALTLRLARDVGVLGMIGGQIIDLENVGKAFDSDTLLDMYSRKTGALLRCACAMGCICAGREDMIPAAEEYADYLGLAFQIIDDILDLTADEAELGKPVHSDEGADKGTYPAVFGLDAAYKAAEEFTAKARAAAQKLPDSGFLCELTAMLLVRKK